MQTYPLLAPLIFIIIRSLAIVIPPIPGIVLDMIGITLFGWKLGFVYGEIGTMIGALVAFWIARQFREPAVRRFIALQKLHAWEDSLSERKKFWTLVSLRIITGPLFFDYINYAAGLTKIQPLKFFFASLISSCLILLPSYYFGAVFLNRGLYLTIIFILIVLIIALIQKWRYKKYYSENNGQPQ